MEGMGSRLERIIYSQTYSIHSSTYYYIRNTERETSIISYCTTYQAFQNRNRAGSLSNSHTKEKKKENKKEPEDILRYRQSTSTYPKIYECRPTRYLMAIYLDDIPPVLNLPVDVKYSGETKKKESIKFNLPAT
jgi:hypothetical protein